MTDSHMAAETPFPISLRARLNELANLAEYLRERNLALAQHLINRDDTIAALQAENERLRDRVGTMATPKEPADGE
ncbi:hypothetical protein [Pararhizobium sp. A13]|uniref:hypothetical protein n=1 Tax=Pararhizobium sp. A13 TaxID=3133975 RepID=UPI0032527C63